MTHVRRLAPVSRHPNVRVASATSLQRCLREASARWLWRTLRYTSRTKRHFAYTQAFYRDLVHGTWKIVLLDQVKGDHGKALKIERRMKQKHETYACGLSFAIRLTDVALSSVLRETASVSS